MVATDRRIDRAVRESERTRRRVGAEIRQARLEHDLSQATAAGGAGLAPSSWSRLERGVARAVPLEDLFRRLISKSILPMPIEQFRVFDGHREVCRADFGYPNRMIVIELDSEQWHMDPATFQRDRHKQNELQALGWKVFRFTWRQLQDDPGHVVSTLATALT